MGDGWLFRPEALSEQQPRSACGAAGVRWGAPSATDARLRAYDPLGHEVGALDGETNRAQRVTHVR